jgi:glycosyltransferase involved in cell wall biosynthesis
MAVSVTNQADLIKRLIEEKGYGVFYQQYISVSDLRKDRNKAFLWFTIATYAFLGYAVSSYLLCKKPKAVYVTLEGIPTKATSLSKNICRLELIANSQFVKDCLSQAGMSVIDVVHHAVDWSRCQELRKDSKQVRAKWEQEYGKRVKILYVGRNDPRKGLDRLEKAIAIVNESMKEKAVFLLFTEGQTQALEALPNVLRVGSVNTLPYDQVFRLMGACDYLIFPSVAEGFGMPVLEANAMGKPVIHSWFPPLSEFSSKDFNFVFGYSEETLVKQKNLQYWIFHEYRPELLAEMIIDAIKIFNDSKKEYQEYCSKALEHTKNWDFRKIYPKILTHLGL